LIKNNQAIRFNRPDHAKYDHVQLALYLFLLKLHNALTTTHHAHIPSTLLMLKHLGQRHSSVLCCVH
jgi:hypothetical protein